MCLAARGEMSEATDASTSSGIPPDAPNPPTAGGRTVPDILSVADQVLSIERQQSTEKPENDEALEWHEVIELQAFSERKVWIEEKIKVRPPCGVWIATFLNSTIVPRTTTPGGGLRRA